METWKKFCTERQKTVHSRENDWNSVKNVWCWSLDMASIVRVKIWRRQGNNMSEVINALSKNSTCLDSMSFPLRVITSDLVKHSRYVLLPFLKILQCRLSKQGKLQLDIRKWEGHGSLKTFLWRFFRFKTHVCITKPGVVRGESCLVAFIFGNLGFPIFAIRVWCRK